MVWQSLRGWSEQMVGTQKGGLQAWALQHGAWEAGMVRSRDQGTASRQREVGEMYFVIGELYLGTS